MDIRFSGKKMTVTAGIQEHFRGKLDRLDKYAPKIVESHVVLKKEKYGYEAEITLLSKNFQACGEGRDKENVYTAIDRACTHVEKQLKRHREKAKAHHKGRTEEEKVPKLRAARAAAAASLREREEALPLIIPSDEFEGKPMSAGEASLQLAISAKPFLVFLNAGTKQVNVLYKLSDGNHGLVGPKVFK